jgi:hypothetical protein
MSDVVGTWSGRIFTAKDIGAIHSLIKSNSGSSRAELSRLVCSHLNWKDSAGRLKDMRCRVVMLRMHEKGVISLPPPRYRKTTKKHEIDSTQATDPGFPITNPVHELTDIRIELVTAKDAKLSRLWNEYIHRYHYLGYEPLIGANIRYMVCCGNSPIAMLGFGAAAWQVASRDKFIGWSNDVRKKNLKYVINNSRFLILPWVESQNLASWLLSKVSKRLCKDWVIRYGYHPCLLETFVDSSKYSGHCYKVSNWKNLGETTGRGKYGARSVVREKKDIWVSPLRKDYSPKLLGD